MRRRTFLGKAAAGTAVLGGIAGTAGASGERTESEHVGSVTTRGHYDIVWNADFWNGGFREVELVDGHSQYDYSTIGTVPGMDAPAPDQLVVVAHGWNAENFEAELTFEVAVGGLNSQDIAVPVVGFEYDADSLPTDWWSATEIAQRNGSKLAAFLYDYRRRNPGTTLRVWGHSLGGQVVLSTLKAIDDAGITGLVDSAGLFGGAVNDESVARGNTYAAPIRRAADEVHNYYSERDEVLELAYQAAEWSSAVGLSGADGPTPANFTDHDVTGRVSNHLNYFDPVDADEGCGPIVAREW